MPTKIEWSDETWNPTTGCDRVSAGCDHCYALTLAGRLKAMGVPKYQRDGERRTSGPGFGLTVHPGSLDQPLRWTRPRRVFVNSMSDLFHPDALRAEGSGKFPFLVEVFAVMAAAERHTFQTLTKRPQLMAAVLNSARFRLEVNAELLRRAFPVMAGGFDSRWPSNLWMGTSIENDRYTYRADHLRATPAAVRFLSLEPLLGPLPSLDLTGIDWVIVGAESGSGARPMDDNWVREIRDQVIAAEIPFFYKQRATVGGHKIGLPELDGRVWDEMPTVPAARRSA
jgi:protein gp37